MKVLVIAAHPDDEVLGCGGTMARLSQRGAQITTAILGQGAVSRHAVQDKSAEAEVQKLRVCSLKAAEILGVNEVVHFDLPDNRFDSLGLLDVIKRIEGLAQKIEPQVVYIQHGGDLNIDHVIAFRAAVTAFRPLIGSSVREVLAYEVPSSTEWAFGKFHSVFNPSIFVDISNTLPIKIKALKAYETEIRPFPHPRSDKGVRVLAEMRGVQVGVSAAEAFEPVWVIR